MHNTRHWARLPFTLVISFVVLTALVWHAPGRGIDESAWGANGPATPTGPQWSSYAQFASWYAGELLHGRGGNSSQFGVPVTELIAERAAVTAGNAWRGFAAAWIAAFAAGILSHFRPASGRIALAAGSLLLSLPSAFVVLTLVLWGAPSWAALAACLWPKAYSYWEALLAAGRRRPHVLSLIAQGAGPWRVQWHGIWRPNLRQFLGLVAVTVPLLLGALIPVEVLCDQPGLGHLAWHAVTARDLPMLTSLTLLFTVITSAMSLAADGLRPEAA